MSRIGFGSKVVDFPLRESMAGYARRTRQAQGTHDPLTASAVVWADRSAPMAVLSLDLLAATDDLVAAVDAGLEEAGIDPTRTIVATTHTHSGPGGDFPALLTASDFYSDQVRRLVVEASTEAAREALASAAEARTFVTTAAIRGIASNRFFTSERPQPRAKLIVIRNDRGPIGSIVNYGAHPTVLDETNLFYSADYVGALRRRIAAQLDGTPVIFLNSASGDLSTRGVRRASSFAEADRLGRLLADELLAADGQVEVDAQPLAAASARVTVRAKVFPSDRETVDLVRRLRASVHRPGLNAVERRTASNNLLGAEHLELVAKGFRDASREVELRALRIGELTILAIPGELFSELGAQIERSSHSVVLLATTANGHIGYIVPPAVHDHEAYESLTSWLSAETTRKLVAVAERLLVTVSNREVPTVS